MTYAWSGEVLWLELCGVGCYFLSDLWRIVANYAVAEMVYLSGGPYRRGSDLNEQKLLCWDKTEDRILFELDVLAAFKQTNCRWWLLTPFRRGNCIYLFSLGTLGYLNLTTAGGASLPVIQLIGPACERAHRLGEIVALEEPTPSLFVVGGSRQSDGSLSRDDFMTTIMDRFDLRSQTWDASPQHAPFFGRVDVAMAIDKHRFIVVGLLKIPGSEQVLPLSRCNPHLKDYYVHIYLFDATEKSWRLLGSFPQDFSGGQASAAVIPPNAEYPTGAAIVLFREYVHPKWLNHTVIIDLPTMAMDTISKSQPFSIEQAMTTALTVYQHQGSINIIEIGEKPDNRIYANFRILNDQYNLPYYYPSKPITDSIRSMRCNLYSFVL